MRSLKTDGFTLLEVLVALSIFAVMTVLAYGGLESTLTTHSHIEKESDKWRNLTIFFNYLERDIGNLVYRPIRDEFDQTLPSIRGVQDAPLDNDAQLTFSTLSGPEAAGNLSTAKRVGYRLRDNRVELLIWPSLDQAPRSKADVHIALESVSRFDLTFLDENFEWTSVWQDQKLPRAIGVNITLETGEEVSRIFAVPLV